MEAFRSFIFRNPDLQQKWGPRSVLGIEVGILGFRSLHLLGFTPKPEAPDP